MTVPTVLFYPGTLDGAAGLRFMGVLEAEHNYRPEDLLTGTDMADSTIRELCSPTTSIATIEEVIKVDQTDEDIIKFEIDEYVVTDAIAKHYEWHPRPLRRDAQQAPRGHRRLGVGLLRLR